MCCENLRSSLQGMDKIACMSESHAHSEKGVRIEIAKPANTQVFKVEIDGCVLPRDGGFKKADLLFCICPEERYCMAELKGAGNVSDALKQLRETYLKLEKPLGLNRENTKLVFVSSSIPPKNSRKVATETERTRKETHITPMPHKSNTIFHW